MDSVSAAITLFLDGGGVVGALTSTVNGFPAPQPATRAPFRGERLAPKRVTGLVRNGRSA
jgi:hypothetical protein